MKFFFVKFWNQILYLIISWRSENNAEKRRTVEYNVEL